MSTGSAFDLVPSLRTMEVFAFQEDDSTFQRTHPDGTTGPSGISVAQLQQRLGSDEGDFAGPSGEMYHISLAAWQGKDFEKTFLQMVFHVTPLFPADIEPELRHASFPQMPAQPSSSTTESDKGGSSSTVVRSKPVAESRPFHSFISCSDVRRDHRIKIQPGNTPDAVSAEVLLKRPEITTTAVACPVCDAIINVSEPLDKRIQQGLEWWGNDAKLQMIFEHPVTLKETHAVPENSPFVVHRYQRYTPISVPARQKDPNIELSLVMKVHDHLITLTSDVGETTAQQLLMLPEAKVTELVCPLCDEKLPIEEPFEHYIHVLADDTGNDTAHIRWSISHPSERTETKTPVQESFIEATHHTSNDDFVQKRYEGYPEFVVRRKKSI